MSMFDSFTKKFKSVSDSVSKEIQSVSDSVSKEIQSVSDSVSKEIQPLSDEVKKLVTKTSHQIHVANDCSEEILVFVAPNKEWAIADSVKDFAVSSSAPGLNTVFLAKSTADLAKNMIELVQIQFAIRTENQNIQQSMIEVFLEKNSVHIPAREVIQVFDQTKLNPLKYLSPSCYAALLDASNMSLIIANKSLGKIVAFNTNSDLSWIVTEEGLVRAKYPKLWEEDRGAGFYRWGTDNL